MQPRSSSLFVAVFLMFLISATMARVWSRKPTEDEDSSAPKESSAPQDSKSDHNDKHDHGRPAHDSKDKEKEKDKGNKNQTTAEDPVPEHTNDDDVFSNPFSEEQASRIKARREQRRREAPAEEKKKPASGTQDGSPIVDPFVPRDADASGEAEAQEDGSDYESSDDHWASNPFESQRHRNNTKSHQKHKGSSSQPGQPDPDPIAGDGDGGDKDKSGKSVVGAGDGEEELESNIPLAPERPESVDNGKTSAPARQQQPRKQQQQKQNQQEQQQQQQQQQKPQQPQIQTSPQPQQQKTSPALKTSVGEAEAKAQQPAQEKSDDRPIWKPWINSYDAGGNYEQVGGFPLGH